MREDRTTVRPQLRDLWGCGQMKAVAGTHRDFFSLEKPWKTIKLGLRTSVLPKTVVMLAQNL